MRRAILTLSAVSVLAASGPGVPEALARREASFCPRYCGKKAAAHCDDIDSWDCGWYILGCLAGCNLARL